MLWAFAFFRYGSDGVLGDGVFYRSLDSVLNFVDEAVHDITCDRVEHNFF